jgi:hypothetical protein
MATKYEEMVGEVPEEEEDAAEGGALEEPAPEPEPEPEPDEPDEPEALAGVDEKALERALKRHETAIRKVLGEAFPDLAPCPTCEGMGYTPEAIAKPPEMASHPDLHACDLCLGLGLVKTGSLRDPNTTISCPRCNGQGYVGSAPSVQPAPANGQAPYQAPPAPVLTPAPSVDPAAIAQLRAAGYVVSDRPIGAA